METYNTGAISSRGAKEADLLKRNNLNEPTNVDLPKKKLPFSAAFSSTSDVRRKRKISKVKTKVKTQRDELAEAVIRGDLQKIEDIIDVLDLLHGRGIAAVLSYKYSYDPDTDVVRSEETSEDEDMEIKTKESQYRTCLNIVHLACIFDQEQVLEFLAMYGHSKLKQRLLCLRVLYIYLY